MARRSSFDLNLPEKANRILNGILVVLILIAIRIWHLAVIQHDDKLEDARRPQRRVIIEKAERATICDRFGYSMAMNKVQFNAAVSYGDIREVPRCVWIRNSEGKKIKVHKRTEYIRSLSELLALELKMDADRIEDLIHSKASIFGNVPFVIKENITEKEYFRLRMLEKDWHGIRAEQTAKRHYPLGAIGGEVIGYLGAIGRHEYDAITQEMHELRECLHFYEESDHYTLPKNFGSIEEVEKRLKELEGKAYTINDFVGKAGVEGAFDEQLRGSRGKKTYLIDIRGNFLRELSGSMDPMPGNKLHLTISAQLQAYAEQLLTEFQQSVNEGAQAVKRRTLFPEKQPWIKSGAIVALDPNTGEVLALASYPRFNPNDFIRSGDPDENSKKKEHIHRWFENEHYLSNLWDQKIPLQRERFDIKKGSFYEEESVLDWQTYIGLILPKSSPVRRILEKEGTLHNACKIQIYVDQLLKLFHNESCYISPAKIFDAVYHGEEDVLQGFTLTLNEKEYLKTRMDEVSSEIKWIQEALHPYFQSLPLNYEKLLLVDLYRVLIDYRLFSPYLMELLGEESLANYRQICVHTISVTQALKEIVKDLFQENHFKQWREAEFKAYLAEKRKDEEKRKVKCGKPYIEYLDEANVRLFNEFWEKYCWDFLIFLLRGEISAALDTSEIIPYLKSLATWSQELKAGAHRALPFSSHYLMLVQLLEELETPLLIPYLKSVRRYDELTRPLYGVYTGLRQVEGKSLEKHLTAAFYPLHGYGYARSHAFRQAATIGSVFKLIPGYEVLRQRYVSMQDHKEESRDLNPLVMIDDKRKVSAKQGGWIVGYTQEGKPIPQFYHGGRLPRSEHSGIGKVNLVRALEASSNPYFSLLSGELINDPEDLCHAAKLFGFGAKTGIDLPGEFAGNVPLDVVYNRTGLYALSIGQHSLVGTPLQTAVMLAAFSNGGKVLKPQIILKKQTVDECLITDTQVVREIFLPSSIRQLLLTGMKQVIYGEKGTARALQKQFPPEILKGVVGKTSTAEVIERVSLDGTLGRLKLNHVGFGAIAFDPTTATEYEKPELIVVVYVRLGEWGNEVAPLAVKMIKKWKEIKAQQSEILR